MSFMGSHLVPPPQQSFGMSVPDWYTMNNYIVRSYRDVIVITKFAITNLQ